MININNIINIPTRKKYKKNKNVLNTIDKFKKEYKNILMQDKTITSIDLHSKYLKEKMNTYLDILKELYFSVGGYTGLDTLSIEDILTYKINVLKLEIYKDKINELQKGVELRLIALNELSLRIKTNRSKNKDALSEEITNLSFTYYIYESQKLAIDNAIESYKHMFLMNNNTLIGDYDKYRKACLNRIESYIKEILPDVYEKSKDLNEEAKLALYEFYLEVWAHKKENINEAKRLLNILKDEYRISYLHSEETRKYFSGVLKDSEYKIRVIYEFNKKIFTEEDIYELYKAKFKVLALSMDEATPFVDAYNEYRDNVAYAIYEKIVQEKIEKVLMGNVLITFSNKETISTLIDLFKNNNIFDIVGILTNPTLLYLLNFVTSTRKTDYEIKELFNNIYSNKYAGIQSSHGYNGYYNAGILLDKRISIRSLWCILGNELIKKESFKKFVDGENIDTIYNLYKLYFQISSSVEEDDIFEIPEGIKELLISKDTKQFWMYRNIEKKLENGAYEIKLPSTMEIFDLSILYNNVNLKMLDLNEGLRNLYRIDRVYADESLKIEELIVPSTLETIDWDLFDFRTLKYITFSNYENSKILRNKELIKKLLSKNSCNCHINGKDGFLCETLFYFEGMDSFQIEKLFIEGFFVFQFDEEILIDELVKQFYAKITEHEKEKILERKK